MTLEQAIVTLKLKLLDMFAASGRVWFSSEQYQEFDRLTKEFCVRFALLDNADWKSVERNLLHRQNEYLSHYEASEIKFALDRIEVAAKMHRDTNRKVFIVHGHADSLIGAVKSLLSEQGLEPIVLREQPNLGRTIIEKFEQNADVGFAVVLLTADDVGFLKSNPGGKELRARQNVVLELGYFMGAHGRGRVAALVEPGVAKPGDVDGLVYISTDSSSWQEELLRELRAANLLPQ